MYCWQWNEKDEKMNLVNIPCKIIIGDKKITQILIQNSIRALGVQIRPSLE